MSARFPENRKHNLAVEFSRYAAFGVGDVLETPDGEEVTVEDFAFRFEIDEFVYWFVEREGGYAETELDEWAIVAEGEREEYIDPGFEDQQIPDPEDDSP